MFYHHLYLYKIYLICWCIIFCNFFVSRNKIKEAMPDMITKTMKKSYILVNSKPKSEVVLPSSGYNALKIPASLFAAALARNHTAISKEANLKVANLFTRERPIGDKHNSPHVCKAYIPIS